MRTILSLVILAAACGGSNNNSDGGDDLSMQSSNDLSAPGGDLSTQFMCNPLTQNCPDPTMPKCTYQIVGTGMNAMVNFVCTPDGTAARDQSCTVNMTTNLDNCVKGLVCSGTSLPMGMAACRKLCVTDGDCSGGTGAQKCRRTNIASNFGLCTPTCTEAFGTATSPECATGTTCGGALTDISSTATNLVRYLDCRVTGPGKPGDPCGGANPPCGDDMLCFGPQGNRQCSPLCDSTHACPMVSGQPDGGMWSCQPVMYFTGVSACQ